MRALIALPLLLQIAAASWCYYQHFENTKREVFKEFYSSRAACETTCSLMEKCQAIVVADLGKGELCGLLGNTAVPTCTPFGRFQVFLKQECDTSSTIGLDTTVTTTVFPSTVGHSSTTLSLSSASPGSSSSTTPELAATPDYQTEWSTSPTEDGSSIGGGVSLSTVEVETTSLPHDAENLSPSTPLPYIEKSSPSSSMTPDGDNSGGLDSTETSSVASTTTNQGAEDTSLQTPTPILHSEVTYGGYVSIKDVVYKVPINGEFATTNQEKMELFKKLSEGDVWIMVFPRCELEMYNIQADGQLNGTVKYVATKRIKAFNVNTTGLRGFYDVRGQCGDLTSYGQSGPGWSWAAGAALQG